MTQPDGSAASDDAARLKDRLNGRLIFVLSGPSGVGKDTLFRGIRDQGLDVGTVVTATTRPPRDGEIPGESYHFLPHATFEHWLADNQLVESNQYGNDWYGTPRTSLEAALRAHANVFLLIDVNGHAQVRREIPNAIGVFVAPGSIDELRDRLVRRGTAPDALARRLALARDELARVGEFAYTIVNADGRLESAVTELASIVRAERCRTAPRFVPR